MRKMALMLAFAVAALSGLSAFAHDADSDDDGRTCNGGAHAHTAAGSCKDTDNYDIDCGDDGRVPVSPGGLQVYVNPLAANGPEVEACNEEGPGQTQGRLNAHVDPSKGYARLTLDSDPDQPQFPPGFISVQVGPGPEQTGVWCAPEEGAGSSADGYSRPPTSPSGGQGGNVTQPDQWVECIPGN